MKFHGKQVLFFATLTIVFLLMYKLLILNTQWFVKIFFQAHSVNLHTEQTVVGVLEGNGPKVVLVHNDKVSMNVTSSKRTDPSNSIVFIRTSTEDLESFELCALYSAAKHNPEFRVIMFSFRQFPFPAYFADLGNVESRILNFSGIFENTPLQNWYESKVWNVSAFVRRVRFLCDASRAAYLYKNGGIYFDTDILCLKSLKTVKNALGHQSQSELNGAFISMDRKHPFIRLVMEIEGETFDPKRSEIIYGPRLLTKAYKRFEKDKPSHDDWPAVNKLSMDLIYPFPYSAAEKLHLKPGQASEEEKRLKEALVVHLWRNKMRSIRGNSKMTIKQGSILHEIAKEHCNPVLDDWISH